MRVPSFVIGDYEYSNSSVYRLTRSTILYPDVIDPAPLLAGGIRREQLVAFRGIKEDISLGSVDTAATAPHRFSEIEDDALVRVLFRPPSERSHYYNPDSRSLALRAFEYLAQQPDVIVIISPRHAWQADELVRIPSRNEPIVLDRPVPFVALLKAVDVVVCSGGTMLREAAYLGVPAYSIFKSRIGGVDRYLASIGRVHLIQSPEALPTIQLEKAPPAALLRSNPQPPRRAGTRRARANDARRATLISYPPQARCFTSSRRLYYAWPESSPIDRLEGIQHVQGMRP